MSDAEEEVPGGGAEDEFAGLPEVRTLGLMVMKPLARQKTPACIPWHQLMQQQQVVQLVQQQGTLSSVGCLTTLTAAAIECLFRSCVTCYGSSCTLHEHRCAHPCFLGGARGPAFELSGASPIHSSPECINKC